MSIDRASHYLVVTLDSRSMEPGHVWSLSHVGCEDCDDAPFTLGIECPGVGAGRCNLWQECDTCRGTLDAFGDDSDARAEFRDQLAETGEVHGEEHQTFDRVPCVETAGCFVHAAQGWSSLDEDLWDIARTHGPGRYEIDWDGGSLDDASAYLVETASA